MQSDGNSFCKAYPDVDKILDQKYENKFVRTFIMLILIIYNNFLNYILTQK